MSPVLVLVREPRCFPVCALAPENLPNAYREALRQGRRPGYTNPRLEAEAAREEA